MNHSQSVTIATLVYIALSHEKPHGYFSTTGCEGEDRPVQSAELRSVNYQHSLAVPNECTSGGQ
jgi:hypothetical protein